MWVVSSPEVCLRCAELEELVAALKGTGWLLLGAVAGGAARAGTSARSTATRLAVRAVVRRPASGRVAWPLSGLHSPCVYRVPKICLESLSPAAAIWPIEASVLRLLPRNGG